MKSNKKGSVIIIIMLFLVSLILLIFTFINEAKAKGIESSVESLGSLWGRSILGEYDYDLEDRYGIFAFCGLEKDISSKLKCYTDFSFLDKKYINYSKCSCKLYNYSLINKDNFKRQVVEEGKFLILKNKERLEEKNDQEFGFIKNSSILGALPSVYYESENYIDSILENFRGVDSIKELLRRTGDSAFINHYINYYFKDYLNGKMLGDTFFKNEIEYIIAGKPDDKSNLSQVRSKIIAIRSAVNFANFLSDEKKKKEALLMAQIITPGPESVVTQTAILAAWAFKEGKKDYDTLINGGKIPWILNDADSDTDCHNSQDYSDYLRILISLSNEDTVLGRIMNLIQINMKYLYNESFLIKDYNVGLYFGLDVNGVFHEFEETYY